MFKITSICSVSLVDFEQVNICWVICGISLLQSSIHNWIYHFLKDIFSTPFKKRYNFQKNSCILSFNFPLNLSLTSSFWLWRLVYIYETNFKFRLELSDFFHCIYRINYSITIWKRCSIMVLCTQSLSQKN